MKTLIPQREHFTGAELLSPAWTLHKAGKSAVCAVWSHQFGFGPRLPRTRNAKRWWRNVAASPPTSRT